MPRTESFVQGQPSKQVPTHVTDVGHGGLIGVVTGASVALGRDIERIGVSVVPTTRAFTAASAYSAMVYLITG